MATKRTQHRFITERWVVTGTLLLETPSHFGNGDADALTDMPLLVDEVNHEPFLPGTSIAGALRNYLRERALGYGKKEDSDTLASALFGGFRGNDEGEQSPLIVFDAPGHSAGIELRDGVAIDPETRTAVDEKKFDVQLLAAGSTFDLRFELAVNKESEELLKALATALQGLEDGQITLGARKSRGFGQVTVKGWHVWKYNLSDKKDLLAWLASERPQKDEDKKPTIWNGAPTVTALTSNESEKNVIAKLLGAQLDETNERKTAHLKATFSIDGTLMIRSGFGQSDTGPDMVHLHSPRPKKDKSGEQERLPVIPGTSWAGVLRQRALKIARTISNDLEAPADKNGNKIFKDKENKKPLLKADVFVDEMFGPSTIERGDKNVKASRVHIKESEIVDSTSLVMTRVKIDRFTGGAYESALFSEQPAVGKNETRLTLDLILRKKAKPDKEEDVEKSEKEFESEIGLLLLLLKDLWTGDLPIGGESSVGRGRLKGLHAILKVDLDSWEFKAKEADGVELEKSKDAKDPQDFVDAFNKIDKWQVNHE
jgi:CRISPR/Cas system CSM-associated protein Csm3 (group 7 of RAMP superfamily)